MKESGYYPPGAEFHPDAPWNQVEKIDPDNVIRIIEKASGLYDNLQELKDTDPSWFNLHQPLSTSLREVSELIDRLNEVLSDLLGD